MRSPFHLRTTPEGEQATDLNTQRTFSPILLQHWPWHLDSFAFLSQIDRNVRCRCSHVVGERVGLAGTLPTLKPETEQHLTNLQIASNLFLSPLRRVPGPFIAKVSGKWLVFKDLAGDRTSTIHRLHQKYGPVVRIGPQELSFSDAQAVREIYGQQTGFMKAPVYEIMSIKPLGVFSLRDKAEHSARRRLLSHAFSQTNLFDCEPLIQQHIEKLTLLVEAGLGKSLNMLSLFRLTAFDIVGKALFPSTPFNHHVRLMKSKSRRLVLGPIVWRLRFSRATSFSHRYGPCFYSQWPGRFLAMAIPYSLDNAYPELATLP